ncbi:MAG: hypothetical protein RH945_02455 [Hyphomonas sp.]
MRLLLVEDDLNKLERVRSFLVEEFPDLILEHAASLVSGLRVSRDFQPGLVVLDMTLPNYDGATDALTNRMRAFGGVEFIRQSVRRRQSAKIVVLTQFESFGEPPHVTSLEDLELDLRESFPDCYIGAVYYHAAQSEWKSKLRAHLIDLVGR